MPKLPLVDPLFASFAKNWKSCAQHHHGTTRSRERGAEAVRASQRASASQALSLSLASLRFASDFGLRPGLEGPGAEELQALQLGDAVQDVLPRGAQAVALGDPNGHEHPNALDVLLPHPQRERE